MVKCFFERVSQANNSADLWQAAILRDAIIAVLVFVAVEKLNLIADLFRKFDFLPVFIGPGRVQHDLSAKL